MVKEPREEPGPSPDDVLRRMLNTPPKPRKRAEEEEDEEAKGEKKPPAPWPGSKKKP